MTKFSQLFQIFLLERYPDRASAYVEEDPDALLDSPPNELNEFIAWGHSSGRTMELEEADRELRARFAEKTCRELAAQGYLISVMVPKANGGFEQMWCRTGKQRPEE
jgi:hypothetical protein